MKIFERLNEETFLLYAANNYKNPNCTDAEEFYDDLNRFKYIKRLLGRYYNDDDLQERLILNHIVILANVFGIEATVKMIWYRVNKEHWPVIKPMLIYLNYIKDTEKMDVPLDPLVVERLRKI
jgi:hypothetical protein